ncbi:AAA domain-containing protein [Saccharibacillus brassicae]|uniref:DNA2/NAM7 helicase-like C-terminal domain-containing protein n=1 Tax=Saccharibacillus brassicae TaxID=2583377 RepID=A0A4Y6UTH0_SACBS|nr:hypothetical protein FFV09_01585 [Saccharibacillus brassicae]
MRALSGPCRIVAGRNRVQPEAGRGDRRRSAGIAPTSARLRRVFQEDVHEEFFVKSLENVQGDERDVIFLSVGYGPAADGSIYYNFGPLSQAKGERRLNVAVTRAKSHMKLVSSMLPEHLPDTKVDGNSGVKHLKRYMQNVLQGRPSARTDRQNRPAPVFDSRVQANIFRVLSELGYIKGLKKKRF